MSTLLEQLEYGFDRDSRRTWRRRALTTGQDDAYGYDGLSQVVNAARGNLNLNATAIGGVPAEDESWDYDPTGNWRGYRVEEDGAVTLEQRRVHDKGNRLMQVEGSAGAVLVDRAGRMTQIPPDAAGEWNQEQRMVWDAWSRLVSVADDVHGVTGSYTYDGLNRRMTRVVSGVTWRTYYSDAWRPLEERQDSQTTAARQYYWGARHRDDLVRRDRAVTSGGALDETRYVLMDYFSPAAITDDSGNVTERYAFSAFGVRSIMAPDFSPRGTSECDCEFGFQGQFLDAESGFYDYGYRYYSPALGRWLSKDPIGEEGGLNLYTFAGNNGVNAVDFFGLKVKEVVDATGTKCKITCLGIVEIRVKSPSKSVAEQLLSPAKRKLFKEVINRRATLEDLVDEIETGHAFLYLRYDTGGEEAWGFYPDKQWFGQPGRIVDDSKHAFNKSRTYKVCNQKILDLKKAIEADKKAPPNYNVTDLQCSTWAVKKARGIGIKDLPAEFCEPFTLGKTFDTLPAVEEPKPARKK